MGNGAGNSITATGTVSIGNQAKAAVDNGIAIGNSANISPDAKAGAIALGADSYAGQTSLTRSYLTDNSAPTIGQLEIGGQTDSGRRITGVADGGDDHDAVNVAQLKALAVSLNPTTSIGTVIGGAGADRFVLASKLGRLLVAMRDKEERGRFSGYDVASFKIFVFCLAAAFSAVGCAMFGLQVGFKTSLPRQ